MSTPIVLDTNVVLDLLVFDDPATPALQQALDEGALRWIATPVMREELARVLEYPHLVVRLDHYRLSADDVLAAFDRQDPADARDGHTLWLHEHLFVAPNHWARGNYGSYWGYHVDRDGSVIDGAGPDHDLFSPILLHEIGHLVMYWVPNAHLVGPEAASNVACASSQSSDRAIIARISSMVSAMSPSR